MSGQKIVTGLREAVAWTKEQERPAERIAELKAENARLRSALVEAEACMSIVAPRSDKAEYLRILGVVRAALAPTQAEGER
ncbi:hypothetical protein [Methylobacterium sp. 1973]|uniref:hypothetical protein n=1 Tax=Methylobacterium sp. 1973 TaxID=3156421 RepID=UPI0033975003